MNSKEIEKQLIHWLKIAVTMAKFDKVKIYPRSHNKIKDFFNYKFKEYATVEILQEDNGYIVTVSTKNIWRIRIVINSSAHNTTTILYRGYKIDSEGFPQQVTVNENSPYKIARGSRKIKLMSYVINLIIDYTKSS